MSQSPPGYYAGVQLSSGTARGSSSVGCDWKKCLCAEFYSNSEVLDWMEKDIVVRIKSHEKNYNYSQIVKNFQPNLYPFAQNFCFIAITPPVSWDLAHSIAHPPWVQFPRMCMKCSVHSGPVNKRGGLNTVYDDPQSWRTVAILVWTVKTSSRHEGFHLPPACTEIPICLRSPFFTFRLLSNPLCLLLIFFEGFQSPSDPFINIYI